MTINALFVYSAATFDIDSKIEFFRAGSPAEAIQPGRRVLAPGVYRLSDGVTVTRVDEVNGSSGEAQIVAVPERKVNWPEPPLAQKLNDVLRLTKSDLVEFFGGASVQTELE